MRHLEALVGGDVVVVTPFVDAHLLRRDLHLRKRTLGDVFAGQKLMDRQSRVMAMRHGPDDVFRTERGVTAKKYLRVRGNTRLGIDLRHFPLIAFFPEVALY